MARGHRRRLPPRRHDAHERRPARRRRRPRLSRARHGQPVRRGQLRVPDRRVGHADADAGRAGHAPRPTTSSGRPHEPFTRTSRRRFLLGRRAAAVPVALAPLKPWRAIVEVTGHAHARRSPGRPAGRTATAPAISGRAALAALLARRRRLRWRPPCWPGCRAPRRSWPRPPTTSCAPCRRSRARGLRRRRRRAGRRLDPVVHRGAPVRAGLGRQLSAGSRSRTGALAGAGGKSPLKRSTRSRVEVLPALAHDLVQGVARPASAACTGGR